MVRVEWRPRRKVTPQPPGHEWIALAYRGTVGGVYASEVQLYTCSGSKERINMIRTILHVVAALVTIAVGAYSMLWPRRVRGFTGLDVESGRGITEIRAVLGGFFVGLGLFAMILGGEAYRLLGAAYWVVAAVRGVSMFVDDSVEQSNIVSIGSELALGLMLLV
jgi:hypothetical protein